MAMVLAHCKAPPPQPLPGGEGLNCGAFGPCTPIGDEPCRITFLTDSAAEGLLQRTSVPDISWMNGIVSSILYKVHKIQLSIIQHLYSVETFVKAYCFLH